jgi:RNA polymerase sigma-70 factor (ECF subfamily)
MTTSYDGSRTSATLLGRLRQQPTNQAAWEEFVDRYGGKIYGWCRAWQLQHADAEDVTQAVLTRLAKQMQTFAYEPAKSFRGWLRTLARHAWSDFVEAQQRAGRASGDSTTNAALHTVAARDDLVAQLEAAFDYEVLDEAGARVRLRVDLASWEAFRLTAVEGLSGAETAQRLGKQVAAVFKAKNRVQKLLQQEVQKLGGDA